MAAEGWEIARSASTLATAHARLLRDHAFQFAFETPPKPQPPPGWLKRLAHLLGGRAFRGAAPIAVWTLWAVIALGVLLIAALLVREIASRRQRSHRVPSGPNLSDWRPDEARARLLLEDADRLAASGRYAEAARVLLHRSIEEIDDRRPALVAVACTSRDIAALPGLPAAARRAFDRIAGHVERSLFGGRSMDGAAFADCRQAYAEFAFPAAWTEG